MNKINKPFIRKEPRKDLQQSFNNVINSDKKEVNEENKIDKDKDIIENKLIISDNNNKSEEKVKEEKELISGNHNKYYLSKKEEEKDKANDKDSKKAEYVSNDILIKNGVEIVKFSEEETNKIFEKKAEMEEKKKNKELKKNKYKNKNNNIYKNDNYYNNNNYNSRETFILHKRGLSNFEKRGKGHFYPRTNYQDFDKFNGYEYDNYYNDYNDGRRYQTFYERGRPNPIYRGSRGRRGRMNY